MTLMASSIPPAAPASTGASNNKYDRQLRLWGADGQRRLANTHVLLFNASATGAETLKNLVLPGVQEFTVVDDQLISLADITNNFFVSQEFLHQPRGKIVTELLMEMNSDVTGHFRHENPSLLLQNEPEYLDQFDLIIATQMEQEQTVETLSHLCQDKNLPLIIVHSYGLIGYYRVQVAQHSILDAKHDPPIHELRLANPFPSLQKFVDSFHFDQLSSIEHAHVPFVVILLQALTRWKQEHDGSLPSNFNEKMAFKNFVQSLSTGPLGHEQNFLEATEQAYKAYVPPIVPEEVRIVLEKARQMELTESSMSEDTFVFWLLAKALVEFVDSNEGLLPVTGIVPDMTASTETYVALQQLYVDKAQQDALQVYTFVKELLKEFPNRFTIISEQQVLDFCKNVYNIGTFEARPLYLEFTLAKGPDMSQVDFDEFEFTTKDQTPLIWYFCIRSAWAFGKKFQRWPGSMDTLLDKDIAWIYQKALEIATAANVPTPTKWIQIDHAKEICRYCEVELHNIAALMGGLASQEAIKLITHQFIPLHHTYVFNGINGQAATYAL